MSLIKSFIVLLTLTLTCSLNAVERDYDIDIIIEGGMNFARPIAVVPFAYEGIAPEPPHNVAAIIAADLRRSGRFNPMAYNTMPQQPTELDQIELAQWRARGIEALVIGKVEERVAGEFTIRYQLLDVFKGRIGGVTTIDMATSAIEGGSLDQQVNNTNVNDHLLLNRTGVTATNNFRFYTHQIADTIYEALTGERGAFATRIAYVTVDRTQRRPYQLYMADSDGYNPQLLYASDDAIMSPTWAPDGRSVAYVSFENGRSEVYLQQIYTGSRSLIAAFPGINSAPTFSPDGKKLALTLSKDGNAEIYVMDLQTRQFRRLTHTGPNVIDTEPEFSPDGQSILFTSDRGLRPQIYQVSVNGGPAKRITFEGEYNASANYTPDGKSIILVNRTNGVYHIAKQDLVSGILDILTDTQLDESPSLAPNGSMVIYATIHNGRQVLAAVSTDGRFKARLPAKSGEVKAPAWSPFLFQ